MKAKMIITIIAITLSTNVLMASQSESTLTFWNSLGQKLEQPLMIDEAVETLPWAVRCEFQRLQHKKINKVFDLSELIKPEKEEELPFYLEQILHSAK